MNALLALVDAPPPTREDALELDAALSKNAVSSALEGSTMLFEALPVKYELLLLPPLLAVKPPSSPSATANRFSGMPVVVLPSPLLMGEETGSNPPMPVMVALDMVPAVGAQAGAEANQSEDADAAGTLVANTSADITVGMPALPLMSGMAALPTPMVPFVEPGLAAGRCTPGSSVVAVVTLGSVRKNDCCDTGMGGATGSAPVPPPLPPLPAMALLLSSAKAPAGGAEKLAARSRADASARSASSVMTGADATGASLVLQEIVLPPTLPPLPPVPNVARSMPLDAM